MMVHGLCRLETSGGNLSEKYILVNDVGTTGTRALIYDSETNVVAEAYTELPQVFPKPGWTEQEPGVIFDKCVEVTRKALEQASLKASDIAAMGIATQRATSMLWDADTGEPVYNFITWQDTRMSDECERINRSGPFKLLHVVGGTYQRVALLSKALKRNPVGKMLIAAAHFTVTPAMSPAHARWTLDTSRARARRPTRASSCSGPSIPGSSGSTPPARCTRRTSPTSAPRACSTRSG
jgi:glycerol kinase